MLKILQLIPSSMGFTAPYKTDGQEDSAAAIVGYALTDSRGILPIIAWGENGEADVLNPETGLLLLPNEDYTA